MGINAAVLILICVLQLFIVVKNIKQSKKPNYFNIFLQLREQSRLQKAQNDKKDDKDKNEKKEDNRELYSKGGRLKKEEYK